MNKLGTRLVLGGTTPVTTLQFLVLETQPPLRTGTPALAKLPVDPQVWADRIPGRAITASPVLITLKDPTSFPNQKQYPICPEAQRGLQPLISRFLLQGLLIPYSSPCNTPILPVKKPNREYRLVQDLRAINEAVVPLHPVIPNPYNLFGTIPGTVSWFNVLGLKDTFFSIPLDPQSYYLFAFEWHEEGNRGQQLTWTVLPQGFQDSPHFFGQALAKNLQDLHLEEGTIIQYVDDLLICSLDHKREGHTTQTLNFLAK